MLNKEIFELPPPEQPPLSPSSDTDCSLTIEVSCISGVAVAIIIIFSGSGVATGSVSSTGKTKSKLSKKKLASLINSSGENGIDVKLSFPCITKYKS